MSYQEGLTIRLVEEDALRRLLDERLAAHLQGLEGRLCAAIEELVGEMGNGAISVSCLTVKDLCGLLKVDDRTIRRWVGNGTLPQPLRLGGALRWPLSQISGWMSGKVDDALREGAARSPGQGDRLGAA